jgi:predicted O-linked N-acetylglucosamine transferase (SPINDLY family)
LDEAPDNPELRYNSALALIREGRGDAALEHTRRLLSSHPEWAGSHAIHGEALLSLADYRGALREFAWVLARLPGDPLACLKRGFALSALGDYAEGRASFAAARASDSAFVAQFCRELSSNPDAPAELCPRSIFLWRRYIAQSDCDWQDHQGYVAGFRDAIHDPSVHLDRALVYSALHTPLDAAQRHQLARRVAFDMEQRIPALPPRGCVPSPRLRIGILSSQFREHVDAHLLAPLFELVDRKRFELYAYSVARDDGAAIRNRIRRAAHRFRDLSALRAADAAQQIRRDEIDILIDVGGYAEGARFEIMAARPAPLQVLYLCFASTLGSDRVDYTILDPIVAPPEHREHWSEQIVYLPDTYFLYDLREKPPEHELSREQYGLPKDAPVLCAFHKGEKIDPETFSLWMRILREHEQAVLWLLGDRPKVVANLRAAATKAGIDSERLVFTGRETRDRYLARLRLADLYLDAIHHNAIVTACDCLAMGLPVLTLHGSTCTSLSAESLLRAAHLSDLVARDRDDYVRRAIRLLRDAGALEGLRARVGNSRGGAPLFDTAARVGELETVFSEMWRRHAAGQPPASFSVPHGKKRESMP